MSEENIPGIPDEILKLDNVINWIAKYVATCILLGVTVISALWFIYALGHHESPNFPIVSMTLLISLEFTVFPFSALVTFAWCVDKIKNGSKVRAIRTVSSELFMVALICLIFLLFVTPHVSWLKWILSLSETTLGIFILAGATIGFATFLVISRRW